MISLSIAFGPEIVKRRGVITNGDAAYRNRALCPHDEPISLEHFSSRLGRVFGGT